MSTELMICDKCDAKFPAGGAHPRHTAECEAGMLAMKEVPHE